MHSFCLLRISIGLFKMYHILNHANYLAFKKMMVTSMIK